MKLLTYLLPIILVPFITPSYAEEPVKNEWATSIGTFGLSVRKSISSDSALFLGANYGLSKHDSGYGFSGSTNHRLGIEVGYRSYLMKTDIHRFFDSSFNYTYFKDDNSVNANSRRIAFMYGLEKYISDEFSVEGSAGISIQSYQSSLYGSDHIDLLIAKLAVNYYY